MTDLHDESAERRKVMLTGAVMLLATIGSAAAVIYFVQMRMRQAATAGGNTGEATHSQGGIQRPQSDYVGNAACVQCHDKIADKYALSAKAQSLLPVGEAPVVEDYSVSTIPGSEQSFRVERSDEGEVTHHQFLTGVFDVGESIEYVLGTGRRERAYLLERSGSLFESPVVWDSVEAKWRPRTVSAESPPPSFQSRVTDDCLRCHAGAVKSAGLETNRYTTPIFVEHAIGCESCHGPGGRHVAKYNANPAATGDDDTIVNPAKLGSRRVDHLCASCHLHSPALVAHRGASLLDFRPGMLLDDVFAVFLRAPLNDAEFRAADQPIQMRASACYLRSEGKLNCQTCHDPHGDPRTAERPAYFNAKCARCHDDKGCSLPAPKRAAANDSCITCHMPKIEGNVQRHTTLTDHRIRRRPELDDEKPIKEETDRLAMFDDGGERVSRPVNLRALNIALMRIGLEKQDIKAAERATRAIMPESGKPDEAIQEMGDDVAMVFSIGEMLFRMNQREAAVKCFEQVLEHYPTHEPSLLWLIRNSVQDKDADAVLKYSKKWLAVQPRASDAAMFRAIALKNAGDTKAALDEAQRVLNLRPTDLDFRYWLEATYTELGEEELAEEQRAVIRRLDAIQNSQP